MVAAAMEVNKPWFFMIAPGDLRDRETPWETAAALLTTRSTAFANRSVRVCAQKRVRPSWDVEHSCGR
jgi:hypothetical protein